MKIQMKLHLLYIVAIVLLASCENEIPYNPDNQQPLLIMNAQLDAGKDVNEVFLHLSKGSSIVRLNEATLTLFINNRIAETPQALTPEESSVHRKIIRKTPSLYTMLSCISCFASTPLCIPATTYA